MADEQVSLASVIIIVLLSGFVIRYLFFASSPPAVTLPQPGQNTGAIRPRDRENAIQTIQQMFPQAERRAIMWDLHRTGGNVAATTERILAGRLETPPANFESSFPPTAPGPSRPRADKGSAQTSEQDLIRRYNLESKVNGTSGEEANPESKGWSSNREERQTALKSRRDEMILAARKKMAAKIAAEKSGSRA